MWPGGAWQARAHPGPPGPGDQQWAPPAAGASPRPPALATNPPSWTGPPRQGAGWDGGGGLGPGVDWAAGAGSSGSGNSWAGDGWDRGASGPAGRWDYPPGGTASESWGQHSGGESAWSGPASAADAAPGARAWPQAPAPARLGAETGANAAFAGPPGQPARGLFRDQMHAPRPDCSWGTWPQQPPNPVPPNGPGGGCPPSIYDAPHPPGAFSPSPAPHSYDAHSVPTPPPGIVGAPPPSGWGASPSGGQGAAGAESGWGGSVPEPRRGPWSGPRPEPRGGAWEGAGTEWQRNGWGRPRSAGRGAAPPPWGSVTPPRPLLPQLGPSPPGRPFAPGAPTQTPPGAFVRQKRPRELTGGPPPGRVGAPGVSGPLSARSGPATTTATATPPRAAALPAAAARFSSPPSPNRARAIALTRKITTSRTVAEILTIVRLERDGFDTVCLAAAIHGLASRKATAGAHGQVTRSAEWRDLVASLHARREEVSMRNLANALWGMAKLNGQVEPRVLDDLGVEVAKKIKTGLPQNTANTLWAYATLGHAPPKETLLAAAQAVRDQARDFVPQNVSNVLLAAAKLSWRPPQDALDALGDRIVASIRTFAPQAIANSLWGVARIAAAKPAERGGAAEGDGEAPGGTTSDQPSDGDGTGGYDASGSGATAEGGETIALVPLFGSSGSDTASAVSPGGDGASRPALAHGLLPFRSLEPLRVLTTEATRRVGEFNTQNLSNSVWAFATLGVDPGHPFLEAVERASVARLHEFSPQNVANALWAFAKLQAPAPRLFAAAAEHLPRVAHATSPQCLANSLWAFAAAGVDPGERCAAALSARAREVARDMTHQHVANCLWAIATLAQKGLPGALGSLRRELPAAMLAELERRMADPQLRKSLTSLHAANAAWALAALGDRVPRRALEALAALSAERVAGCGRVELSNLLWAFAKLGQYSPALFDAGCAEATARADRLGAQNVANLLWACAKVGHDNAAFWRAMQRRAAALLPALSAQNLSNIFWALGTAHLGDPGVVRALAREHAARAANEPLNLQQVSNSLWGLAMLDTLAQDVWDASMRRLQAIEPAPNLIGQETRAQLFQAKLLLEARDALSEEARKLAGGSPSASGASDANGDGIPPKAVETAPVSDATGTALGEGDGAAVAPCGMGSSPRPLAASSVDVSDYDASAFPPPPPPALLPRATCAMPEELFNACRDAWRANAARVTISDFHAEVAAALAKIAREQPGGGAGAGGREKASGVCVAPEVVSGASSGADATTPENAPAAASAAHGSSNPLPPPDASSSPVPSVEVETLTSDGLFSIDVALPDERIAVEVDGPRHFSANGLRPLGETVARRVLLRARGWAVVSVPFFKWTGWEEDERERELRRDVVRARAEARARGLGTQKKEKEDDPENSEERKETAA